MADQIIKYLSMLQSKIDALKRHHGKTAALAASRPAVLERAFRGEL